MSVILTSESLSPIGPYSQAIRSGNLLYTSACGGFDPVTRQLVSPELEPQIVQMFTSLQAVVEAGGASLSSVVKATVFLKSMEDFSTFNEVYGRYFPMDREPPARTTFAVAGLPMNSRVAIEVTALCS